MGLLWLCAGKNVLLKNEIITTVERKNIGSYNYTQPRYTGECIARAELQDE
jgi:hypothetical protein